MTEARLTMYVRPREDVLVRDPIAGDALPEGGRRVPRNGYWLRRLKDGDVLEGEPEAEVEPELEPETTTSKGGRGRRTKD